MSILGSCNRAVFEHLSYAVACYLSVGSGYSEASTGRVPPPYRLERTHGFSTGATPSSTKSTGSHRPGSRPKSASGRMRNGCMNCWKAISPLLKYCILLISISLSHLAVYRATSRSHPYCLFRNVLFHSGSSRQSLTTASSHILNFLLLGLGLG